MPSPFPGMNPYLERSTVWHGFHECFVIACQWALVPQIRPEYIVTVDDHIYIEDATSRERELLGLGDVVVKEDFPAGGGQTVVATVDAPVVGRVPRLVNELREAFIEIRDRESREVITVIEILSPTNKREGKDREQFLYKRDELMISETHYVEIDLLRGGPRLPIENLPQCAAYSMVSRLEDRPTVGLWPTSLREPLPTIPIPLRPPKPDARLDLQAVLHQTYDASGYADYIYRGKPEPPLEGADRAWAEELIAGSAT